MAEIPFFFHDRPKWVSGISRQTTCQDVLLSLVKSHLSKRGGETNNNDDKKNNEDPSTISKQLVLVEQWRGVERPLSGASRILKLWQAWGEERSQVRFIVKRVSSSSSSSSMGAALPVAAATGSYSSLSRSRKTRRRNSRTASSSSALADTQIAIYKCDARSNHRRLPRHHDSTQNRVDILSMK